MVRIGIYEQREGIGGLYTLNPQGRCVPFCFCLLLYGGNYARKFSSSVLSYKWLVDASNHTELVKKDMYICLFMILDSLVF